VLQYIIRYPTTEFYKTSESHMSLSSLASKVFFEGCGLVKSFFPSMCIRRIQWRLFPLGIHCCSGYLSDG
jgi:hypothetical protein